MPVFSLIPIQDRLWRIMDAFFSSLLFPLFLHLIIIRQAPPTTVVKKIARVNPQSLQPERAFDRGSCMIVLKPMLWLTLVSHGDQSARSVGVIAKLWKCGMHLRLERSTQVDCTEGPTTAYLVRPSVGPTLL